MEQRDLDLIQKYIADDVTLRKLYDEHLDLEQKLGVFNGRNYLTPGEEMEQARLKKIKLKGKDQIEDILRKYRQAGKSA